MKSLKDVEIWSDTTGTMYPNYAALVAAEAHGWILTCTIMQGKKTWPWSIGFFATEAEAKKARARWKARFKRAQVQGEHTNQTYIWSVRPLWKHELYEKEKTR